MNRIGTLSLVTVSLLLVACDPAITIRQTSPSNATAAQIQIQVKAQRQLIGNTWYVPPVTITNASDTPICITSIELVTKQGTYANNSRHGIHYPLNIEPGK